MKSNKKVRGVNLGGWLVLERWMTPSLFEGYKAEDETNFVIELGDKAESVMKNHYDTWITEVDFKWIKELGLNAVRIPVGHWIFGDCPPYVGAIKYLDLAMEWGKKYELGILIDFHAAPGSQNGFDNGGILGVLSWHKSTDNIDKSVEFIERLAKRYGQHEALYGIQLLNEPHWEIPMDLLQDFHLRAYQVARQHMHPNACVVMHDSFRLNEWEAFFKDNTFENVILDTHQYQCFREEDGEKNLVAHLIESLTERGKAIKEVATFVDVCVGEWSLGLHPICTADLSSYLQENVAPTLYGHAQIIANEESAGWFFWSYKLEEGVMPHWNFKACVNRGWLPKQY